MARIKIAQIGIGHDHAEFILRSIVKQTDTFEFVGLFVPEQETEIFADKLQIPIFRDAHLLTLQEILEDESIVAVAIESREQDLSTYAIQCAKAKKQIHLDKPGSLDIENFEKLVSICKTNETVLHMGYMYRYNPVISEAIQKVKSGALGNVFSVEAQMSVDYDVTKREWLGELRGGMMYFLGCHLIDLIYSLQGEPKEVIPYKCASGKDGCATKDYSLTLFSYENGMSFAKVCATEKGGFGRRQLVITGTKGTIEIRPLEEHDVYPNTYTKICEVIESGEKIERRSSGFDRYDGMMKGFAEIVTGERENQYTYDYELDLFRLFVRSFS